MTDNWYVDINEYPLEVFHHCLGYFKTENDRKAHNFIPLSSLIEPSPDAGHVYLSNYGEVATKFVQTYEVIRKDKDHLIEEQEVKFMDTYSATVTDQGEITIKRHGMPIVYHIDNVLRDAIYELASIQENLVK